MVKNIPSRGHVGDHEYMITLFPLNGSVLGRGLSLGVIGEWISSWLCFCSDAGRGLWRECNTQSYSPQKGFMTTQSDVSTNAQRGEPIGFLLGVTNRSMGEGLYMRSRDDSRAAASQKSPPHMADNSGKLRQLDCLDSCLCSWASQSPHPNPQQSFTPFYSAGEGWWRNFKTLLSQTCDL